MDSSVSRYSDDSSMIRRADDAATTRRRPDSFSAAAAAAAAAVTVSSVGANHRNEEQLHVDEYQDTADLAALVSTVTRAAMQFACARSSRSDSFSAAAAAVHVDQYQDTADLAALVSTVTLAAMQFGYARSSRSARRQAADFRAVDSSPRLRSRRTRKSAQTTAATATEYATVTPARRMTRNSVTSMAHQEPTTRTEMSSRATWSSVADHVYDMDFNFNRISSHCVEVEEDGLRDQEEDECYKRDYNSESSSAVLECEDHRNIGLRALIAQQNPSTAIIEATSVSSQKKVPNRKRRNPNRFPLGPEEDDIMNGQEQVKKPGRPKKNTRTPEEGHIISAQEPVKKRGRPRRSKRSPEDDDMSAQEPVKKRRRPRRNTRT